MATQKQRAFAEHYALDHNGAAAAVRAGYAPGSARQTASELLAKPEVQALVADHEALAAERLGVTKERVLAELQAAVELARQKGDVMAMISAWREIGKMIGAYAPERKRVEVSLEGDRLRAKYEAMSDRELLAIAEGKRERP